MLLPERSARGRLAVQASAPVGDFEFKIPDHAGQLGVGLSGESGDQISVRLLDCPASFDESIERWIARVRSHRLPRPVAIPPVSGKAECNFLQRPKTIITKGVTAPYCPYGVVTAPWIGPFRRAGRALD